MCLPSSPCSGSHVVSQCSQQNPSFGPWLFQPHPATPHSQPPGLSPLALQHCPSLSAAWRRALVWTDASPGSCCPWGPPSTWTGPPCMRLWPPSSSPKSTTMSSTWARSRPSGEVVLSGICQQVRPKKSLAWLGVEGASA